MRPLPVSSIRSGETCASVEKSKFAPRRPATAARTCPEPLTSLALAVSRASVTAPASTPRASTTPSRVVRSSARMMVPSSCPLWTANAPGKFALSGRQMRVDPLRARDRREVERSPECAAGQCQSSGEPTRIGTKIAARMRAAGVEGRNGDGCSPVRRQQDLAVAGEGTQLRAATRPIIETCRSRD